MAERERRNIQGTNSKMVYLNLTILEITLSINGPREQSNEKTEITRSAIKNKTQQHAAYKKPTLNIKTYRDGKRYTILTLIRRKLSGYITI